MLILAIDCAGSLCAACVWDVEAGAERGREVRDLGRGHAEHLIGVIEAALAAASASLGDLGEIAVSVGPGSFTGIRVAVSAARGLALSLGIEASGVATLEALAAEARQAAGSSALAVVQHGGPDLWQLAVYHPLGDALYSPRMASTGEAASMVAEHQALLAGAGAAALARSVGLPVGRVVTEAPTADIATYARIAASRRDGAARLPAIPLYLREPDAKPQAGFVLPRRDGL